MLTIESSNNKILTPEQLGSLEESPVVASVNILGASSSHIGYTWFDVELINGNSVDVFVKF